MRAIVWHGPGRMTIEERSEPPDPGAGELIVRPEAVGICGSEVEGYLGHMGNRTPPLVMGHEFAGVVVAAGAGAEALDGGAGPVGDPRATAVGADGDGRGGPPGGARLVAATDPGDASVAGAHEVRHDRAEAELGAGLRGRVGEDRVEDRAAWCVQRVDPVGGLDRDRQRLVDEVERGAAHRRRPRRDHPVEQSPAVELHHAAAHQGVGRLGVVAVAVAVDDQDA